MTLPNEDFTFIQEFLYRHSGLSLTVDKTYLIESRLNPIAKDHELDGLSALIQKMKAGDQTLHKEVIEAMTTNETFFFRDTHPFEKFTDVILPKVMENKPAGSTIKIWCAACSSGQEPYSLAILLKEGGAKYTDYKFDILATDLSEDILESARKGVYTQFEVQRGMPITMLVKYFTQQDTSWTINDDIKSMVRLEKFNLLDSMAAMDMFDIIFCRNVLIYFDAETKGKVLAQIQSRLQNYGFLVLGGAETVVGITDVFKPMKDERGLYLPHNSVYAEAAA